MKVRNSKQYLRLANAKLNTMQESDFDDIDIDELGRIAFNIGKVKEFEDEDNYTIRELITLFIKTIKEEYCMKVNNIVIGKWYMINGRKLKVIANVNFLRNEPYLLLQGEVGGELKMYHSDIITKKEVL